jgi:hypothetical protein
MPYIKLEATPERRAMAYSARLAWSERGDRRAVAYDLPPQEMDRDEGAAPLRCLAEAAQVKWPGTTQPLAALRISTEEGDDFLLLENGVMLRECTAVP